MKINLSKILRYILIVLINISFIFVLQYYLNLQTNINKSLSDLKIAMFIDSSSEKTEDDILSEMLKYKKLKSVEFVNSYDDDKFSKINPELETVVPEDAIIFPSFMLVNITDMNSLSELENLKKELLNTDFINDIVYDQKAYKMFFDNKILLNRYNKIFRVIFYLITAVFFFKFLFYILKGLYKDILFEMICGILLGLCAYALICLATIFKQNDIFMLSEQILYVLVPLSSMVTLVTKESNV